MTNVFNNSLIQEYNIKFNTCYWQEENLVWLNLIHIPKKYQNKGLGTKILNDFVKWLDENKFNSKLLVGDCYGLSEKILVDFYKKFGYDIDYRKGKNLYLERKYNDKN